MQLALQIVLIITSVLLVLLILLHRGRGGGLSTLFGGGMQSSLSAPAWSSATSTGSRCSWARSG